MNICSHCVVVILTLCLLLLYERKQAEWNIIGNYQKQGVSVLETESNTIEYLRI